MTWLCKKVAIVLYSALRLCVKCQKKSKRSIVQSCWCHHGCCYSCCCCYYRLGLLFLTRNYYCPAATETRVLNHESENQKLQERTAVPKRKTSNAWKKRCQRVTLEITSLLFHRKQRWAQIQRRKKKHCVPRNKKEKEKESILSPCRFPKRRGICDH